MPVELSEMFLEAVLRTYSSVKGHRTRCEREIENLLGLLTTRYSSISEERIKERLESREKHTIRLSDIKHYLVHLKYAKAKDHDEEVQEFLVILDRCSSDVLEILHNRHATAQVNAPQAAQQVAPGPAPKAPTSDLNWRNSRIMLQWPHTEAGVNSSGPTLTLAALILSRVPSNRRS